MNVRPRAHVIGCGVLAIDVRRTAERLGIETGETWLEAGLHDRPGELRRRLQTAIDEVSGSGGCERIIVGYGICGRGTVGLHARCVPLVIPKAHDCIALFLGSDAAYKREFARFPGTYYVSAGWYEGKVQPREARRQDGEERGDDERFEELVARYGEENARAIVDFMNSWQRNYQRAAFIDTGSGTACRYGAYAEAMAEEFGWHYERLPGDLALIESMLTAERSTDSVLVVPPGQVTTFDAVGACLAAGPPVRAEEALAPTPHERTSGGPAARLGLGIDAGGTYTDAVIYDFTCDSVLGKAKALTTRWDYAVGIREALDGLDAELVRAVDLVALSTTLATNAIVEGQGQRVGLLVMPPEGLRDEREFPHRPCAILRGRLDIAGHELEPVDLEEVRQVARQMEDASSVAAFAVSGYAGAVNPAHELAVKAAIREETGLSVTCGHELSALLNFRARADTAVLNARIIPRLDRLLADVRSALAEHEVAGRLMVVKGDGSLISAEAARERPVETVLSGPAASVAGARKLTGKADAIVVDMGGTTTDTALLVDGRVGTCPAGARVGAWQTHVQALDMRTAGLGGDSLIAWEGRRLSVGPRRVAPVAWLAHRQQGTAEALHFLESRVEDFDVSSHPMELAALAGHTDGLALTEAESRVMALLEERPHSLAELAERAGLVHWQLLRLDRLEEHQIVQRCGLTPTDLLHVRGSFERWDSGAAERLSRVYEAACGFEGDGLVERILEQVVRGLAVELLKKQLDEQTDADALDACPACQALVGNLLAGGSAAYTLGVTLHRPVIGLGAPVHSFLPQAATLLGAEVIVPHDADVANAIGAITSEVVVEREAHIRPAEDGGYAVHGLPEARSFGSFDAARDHAVAELSSVVRGLGAVAGTGATRVGISLEDRISAAADGTEIFLERIVRATLRGSPSLLESPATLD